MAIKLKLPCEISNIEGKFDLELFRERLDIKELLLKIREGKKLNDLFPISVAESLRTQFASTLSYIDKNDKLLSAGEEFINNPYKSEKESGVYFIEYATICLGNKKINLFLRMYRNLDKMQKNQVDLTFDHFIFENSIKIGNNEIIRVSKITNLVRSRVLQSKLSTEGSLLFDITTDTYTSDYGTFDLGPSLNAKVRDYVLNVLSSKVKYLEFDSSLEFCYIKSLDDITEEDRKNGFIGSLEMDDIEVFQMPFKINSKKMAIEYAYWYLYDKIMSGSYLSLSDMNDLYQNEILNKDIFDDKIMDELYNVTITQSGFKEYLSDSKYTKLSYKLKVMKVLLDYEINKNDNTMIKSYPDLAKYMSQQVDYKNVERMFMVMGWPYVNNSRNKMIECVNEFKKYFPNVIIIKKQPSNLNSQKEDLNIKNELIESGVQCYESFDIQNAYHDRFLIFDMGKTSKVFLMSCEIGQYFSDKNEARGYIHPLELADTYRNGKNILQYVKECK